MGSVERRWPLLGSHWKLVNRHMGDPHGKWTPLTPAGRELRTLGAMPRAQLKGFCIHPGKVMAL